MRVLLICVGGCGVTARSESRVRHPITRPPPMARSAAKEHLTMQIAAQVRLEPPARYQLVLRRTDPVHPRFST